MNRLVLWVGTVFLTLLGTVLIHFYFNISNSLALQQASAAFTVFARTNLSAELNAQLEQNLRALTGVESVSVTSSQEGLEIAMKEMSPNVDEKWLNQKQEILQKSGDSILPYSFDLRLKSWEKSSVENLKNSILAMKENPQSVAWVSQVYYSSERQTFINTLKNYCIWMQRIFIGMTGFIIFFVTMGLAKWMKMETSLLQTILKKVLLPALGLAIICCAVYTILWGSVFGFSIFTSKMQLLRLLVLQWAMSGLFLFSIGSESS